MHNHNHLHCQHNNVKYCHHCNLCYCVDCNEEWGQHKVTYTYTTPYRWIYQGTPYTITWGATSTGGGSIGNYTITASNGNIVTDKNIVNAFQTSGEYRNTIGCKSTCTHQ